MPRRMHEGCSLMYEVHKKRTAQRSASWYSKESFIDSRCMVWCRCCCAWEVINLAARIAFFPPCLVLLWCNISLRNPKSSAVQYYDISIYIMYIMCFAILLASSISLADFTLDVFFHHNLSCAKIARSGPFHHTSMGFSIARGRSRTKWLATPSRLNSLKPIALSQLCWWDGRNLRHLDLAVCWAGLIVMLRHFPSGIVEHSPRWKQKSQQLRRQKTGELSRWDRLIWPINLCNF